MGLLDPSAVGAIFCLLAVSVCASRVPRNTNTWTVTTVVEAPYVSKDGEKFVGYIPDLMDKLAKELKIDYDLKEVADGKYGQKQNGNNWNGMIKELIDGKAVMAAAPMTITEERKKVISFSEPIMEIETTFLVKKPKDGEEVPFKNAEDLSKLDDIKFGLVRSGTTENFFKTTDNETYKKLWAKMEKDQSQLVDSNKKGVDKVRESDGKYVFIIESSTADYYINRKPCDLTKVSKVSKAEGFTNHYGLGLRQDFAQKKELNDAIKKLKADGVLDELKEKWWKGDCDTSAAYRALPASLSVLLSSIVLLVQKVL